jgi:hypothetical protein
VGQVGSEKRQQATGGATSGMLIAGAVTLLALPSAVLAFSARFEPNSSYRVAENGSADGLAVAPGVTGLAPGASLRSLAGAPLFPFTPAGTANRPNRSVTVAVRLDPQTVKVISVLGQRAAPAMEPGVNLVPIAPTAFNLGVARGYVNFAPAIASSSTAIRPVDLPDLAAYRPKASSGSQDTRFSPRIVIDEKEAAGRAPGTFAGDREDRVDVGGSYRLTRNLDVTAGVRYKQDRERLKPITDGSADSQAVYVGTQFRF